MKYMGKIQVSDFFDRGYSNEALENMQQSFSKGYVEHLEDKSHILIMDNFGEQVYVFQIQTSQVLDVAGFEPESIVPYLLQYFSDQDKIDLLPEDVQLIVIDRILQMIKPEFMEKFEDLILYGFNIIRTRILDEFLPIIQRVLDDFGMGVMVTEAPLIQTMGSFVPHPDRAEIVVIAFTASTDIGFDSEPEPSLEMATDLSADIAWEIVEYVQSALINSKVFGELEQARFLEFLEIDAVRMKFMFITSGFVSDVAAKEIEELDMFSLEQLRQDADDFNLFLGPFDRWAEDNLD